MIQTMLVASLLAGSLSIPGEGPVRIALTTEDGALAIRGIFAAPVAPARELRYALAVTKRGASGQSTSRQSGAFTPTPNAVDSLSTVRLGVQPGDRIEVRLDVHDGERPVGDAHHVCTVAEAGGALVCL